MNGEQAKPMKLHFPAMVPLLELAKHTTENTLELAYGVESSLQTEKEERKARAETQIVTIKRMVEDTKAVSAKDASFEFFEALGEFRERFPAVCGTIEKINITLDPQTSFDHKQYVFVGAVLSTLILCVPLKELTLQYFDPIRLLACLATVQVKEQLQLVNLENNSIRDDLLRMILRALPPKACLKLVLSHNWLEDTVKLAMNIPRFRGLRIVEILCQASRSLDEMQFKEALQKYHPNWTGAII